MEIGRRTSHRRQEHRTNAVLHALLQLGPGPHKFREVVARTAMDKHEVHRRLLQLFNAQLCDRPRYGYWELRPAAATPDLPGLVHPAPVPPLNVTPLLESIHSRTRQVALLHTHSPLTGERLCIAAAGVQDTRFRRELALTPEAVDRLRQAPLDSDAPGLAMLANLASSDAPLRKDLREIRASQVAVTVSPLPGWILCSVPMHRLPGAPAMPGAEPRVVAAVSVLAPDRQQGDPVVAYGRLVRNAVHRAAGSSVVVPRPRAATAPAA
ncbi:hypothetical protein ACF073_35640 [Streptomyces sp. NPDC015171]|uniref:hypothetical protein n=1 Tax=Streptomyces sp. NPDC015171 TaxID=3364945 RepID=UPI0037017F42